jgi:FkbH-like protein/FkbM family methyltransferase
MTGSKRLGFERQLVTHNEELLREKAGEFLVGLKSIPYLADHCVQDMAVLPGSAYLEMLIIVSQRSYKQVPAVIRGVQFKRAIILTDDDATVIVRLSENVDKSVRCDFYEDDRGNDGSVPSDPFCSIAGIQLDNTSSSRTEYQDFSVQQFQSSATEQIDSRVFYERLHSRGNQYGPEFQSISQIWLSGTEALGKLTAGAKPTLSAEQNLGPVLLDSFVQLLSCLGDDKGRSFVLSSIEEIRIRRLETSGCLWSHARILQEKKGGDKEFCGDVRVFDSSGEVYLEFVGVHCQYLDRESSKAVSEVKNYEICIASTFTADPVEDSLRFWSDYLGISSEIRFAPYGQVLQQLLNPESMFRKNNRGVNIVLLGLEDLNRPSSSLAPVLSSSEAEKVFAEKARYTLPNGMEIAHLNKYETDYLYKEIFLDECYLRHGIVLEEMSTIVDIGANIGLFSLFVSERCRDAKIYAFEPSPMAFSVLKTNCRLYGLSVKAFGLGVSDRKKVGKFTFYKNASVFSGFQASEDEDRQAIRSVVRNMLNEGAGTDTGSFEEYIDEILRGRLESTSIDCQMLSVSDIIETNGIEKIDLLKIDAEKSELDILRGIRDADWPKIRQLVVEVHDRSGQALADAKTLLEGRGFDLAVEEEVRLKGSGLFNIYAKKGPAGTEERPTKNSTIGKLEENLQLFREALDTYARAVSAPVIVGVCPQSPNVVSHPEKHFIYEHIERRLLAEIGELASVYPISTRSFLRGCPADQYFDSHTEKLGHIPYTPPFFASMGTSLARTIFALTSKPFKVLVLDCDNTLWKGVCGEDGYQGVIVSEPYRRLQELAVAQTESGVLVCLCSKNNADDVLEVFDRRDDMALKRKHLVTWRLNWEPKSANLRSLAAELNVGLDSFIFIDDNPVECADIRSNCPEVLTLKLPSDESKIAEFLANIWALDHLKLSSEDKKRTQMYRESAQRDTLRKKSLTLRDFIDGLKLEVFFFEPKPEQLGRISQLTYRTNQFNFTTIRRSEAEISSLLTNGNYRGLAIEVRDRFGDYGLVGVVIYEMTAEALKVDTFLLSCRVLGRGIEHRIAAELGRLAGEMNIGQVEIKYVQSGKNQPALEFISSIGSNYRAALADGQLFRLPAEYLRTIKYEPPLIEEHQPKSSEGKSEEGRKYSAEGQGDRDGLSEKMQEIAEHLHVGQAVLERIERFRVEQQSHGVPEYVEPGTSLERELAKIWQNVLGKSQIGLTQNFFETGGTSLRAVQLIAAIKKNLGVSLPLTVLFECPTIALMAAKLSSKESGPSASAGARDAMSRGARRRQAGFPRKTGG